MNAGGLGADLEDEFEPADSEPTNIHAETARYRTSGHVGRYRHHEGGLANLAEPADRILGGRSKRGNTQLNCQQRVARYLDGPREATRMACPSSLCARSNTSSR